MESRIVKASLREPSMHNWFNWASINFGFEALDIETLLEIA
jgi:hypothetical protein